MKEKWQRPQLVCLYRGKPEESVLSGCKLTARPSSGPLTRNGRCDGIDCCDCHAQVTS